ncbi:MAG TPA: tRNA-binding protein [Blastocatellia bacterium]
MQGQSNTIEFAVFEQLDVRVGVISSVLDAEGCRVPAYKLEIDFGPEVGMKRSIAQAKNYPVDALLGKQVLAVVNLKPRQVGKHISEVLVLGVPTRDQGTALVVPDLPAVIGGRLF